MVLSLECVEHVTQANSGYEISWPAGLACDTVTYFTAPFFISVVLGREPLPLNHVNILTSTQPNKKGTGGKEKAIFPSGDLILKPLIRSADN